MQMQWSGVASSFFAFVLGIAAASSGAEAATSFLSAPVVQIASFACKLSHGEIVCSDHKGNKKKGSGGQDSKTDSGNEGEHSCPAGYVVLKEKNKYGAWCEPKEGFPEQASSPTSTDVCCTVHRPEGEGPVICSHDSETPETAAQIQHTELKLFPEATITCKPEK
jgi:hypothetical protein